MIPLYPWEGRLELYGTVWRDPDGTFRMWYQGMGGMGIAHMGLDLRGTPFEFLNFDLQNLECSICFATSEDGIHWKRPNMGLIEFHGTKDNNILIPDACFANVIEDTRDPDPDRLYKSLFFEARDWDPRGTPNTGEGVSVAFSPDGVRWTKYPGNPVITRASDSHMLLGWDDLAGSYVAYARPTTKEGNPVRRIGRSTSDDFHRLDRPPGGAGPGLRRPARHGVLRHARLPLRGPLPRLALRLPSEARGAQAAQLRHHRRAASLQQGRRRLGEVRR